MLFDPSTFLSAQVSGAMETRFSLVPNGTYHASVKKLALREVNTQRGTVPVMDVSWNILDTANLQDKTLAGKPVRQSIFLDVTKEGHLELGSDKNIKLGRLREALRQNDLVRAWSPSMLLNGIAEIEVTAREGDGGEIYNDVARVNAV